MTDVTDYYGMVLGEDITEEELKKKTNATTLVVAKPGARVDKMFVPGRVIVYVEKDNTITQITFG